MDSKLLNTIDQIEVDTINITHVQTSLFIYCRATPFFGWIHHGQSAFPICIYLLSFIFLWWFHFSSTSLIHTNVPNKNAKSPKKCNKQRRNPFERMQNWERWHKPLCYENQEGSWSEFRVGYTLWVAHGRCIVICWCNIRDVIITLTHSYIEKTNHDKKRMNEWTI